MQVINKSAMNTVKLSPKEEKELDEALDEFIKEMTGNNKPVRGMWYRVK